MNKPSIFQPGQGLLKEINDNYWRTHSMGIQGPPGPPGPPGYSRVFATYGNITADLVEFFRSEPLYRNEHFMIEVGIVICGL